jgi:hypothetical protein
MVDVKDSVLTLKEVSDVSALLVQEHSLPVMD